MNSRKRTVICLSLLVAWGCSPQPSEVPASPDPAAVEHETTPKPIGPAPAATTPTAADAIARAIAAEDRSAEDKELDAQRKPAELLEFFGVAPGQRVAELAAGKGYTTELLARVVGPQGQVYGQNSPFILKRFAEGPWSERLKTPAMANVIRVDTEFDAPLPAEASNLDAVFLILFYHDTVWFKTDRAKMNQAIFAALKPGGIYAIVDHSAKEGEGVRVAESLHRIEEQVLKNEILAAGFRLEAEADFLRNPQDTRDWSASPSTAGERRGESDRFVLRFIKPLDAEVTQPQGGSAEAPDTYTQCTEPRSTMCTREYRPVCADVDTGIRCVTTPCNSSEKKTYANGCTACADPKVIGYAPGACSAP